VDTERWLGSTEHDGLIGAPILMDMVVIFDYARERISFTDRQLFPLLEPGFELTESSNKSAMQAVGAPDAVDKASCGQAWWPADSHGTHWIELTYAEPVQPVRLELWGTYAQGALTAVLGTTESDGELTINWAGQVEQTLDDGLQQKRRRPGFSGPAALEQHAERLENLGQAQEAASVRERIEALAGATEDPATRAQK
jgi:hypothetical protein